MYNCYYVYKIVFPIDKWLIFQMFSSRLEGTLETEFWTRNKGLNF